MKEVGAPLTRADEILLLAILRLGDEANGINIRSDILERAGKKLSFGSLWVSLDLLRKRGLVEKHMADPTPRRGGRGQLYYRITPEGIHALDSARRFQEALWKGIPDRISNLKKS